MDESLLKSKGVMPGKVRRGFVDGYGLCIGERATLIRRPDDRSYGVVMDIVPGEAKTLYAEDSVSDYVPEPVIVELMDGTKTAATCYNLPRDKITGTNKDYADSLLDIAGSLGFPESYLDEIRRARS